MRGTARKGRGRVNWNAGVVPARQLKPHPHMEGQEFPPEYEDYMTVGSLWVTDAGATIVTVSKAFQQHQIPYAVPSDTARWYIADEVIRPGATAVYMGTTRVSEIGRTGHMLQVPRHTFLVGGTRVMVFDPTTFRPAALARRPSE